MLDPVKSVCFSGHRSFKMSGGWTSLFSGPSQLPLSERLTEAIRDLYDEGYKTFLCGMAEGFDLLAGEAVAALKKIHSDISLIAVLPHAAQAKSFSGETRQRYNKIIALADRVITVLQDYRYDCFHRRNDFLVDNSSVLICYFNGIKGGTQYTVKRALKAGHRVINLL